MNANVPAPPAAPDFEKRTTQFLALRDKIKEIEDRHKAELKPYKEAKEKLEAYLLNALNAVNTDSTSNGAGTVYRTARKTATIEDGEVFRQYVILSNNWDLLDWKCNVRAAEDFIEENNVQPPGTKFTTTYTVGVRRK